MRVALIVSVGLGLVAVAAVIPIVAPAPSRAVAFAAVALGEKTFLVAGLALLAAGLGLHALGPSRLLAGLAVLLAALALGGAVIPPVQALRLAAGRAVTLSPGRYLRAPIDDGPARPDTTVAFAAPAGSRQTLSLDVYRPNPTFTGPRPAVIVVHGGGWSVGDKGETPLHSARLAAEGYAVFDVQYRLAPRPTWRAALGDVKCAVGWVKAHAAELGVKLDPARVTLLGRSAGGHLALLAAYTAGDPTLPPSCADREAEDPTVASVISFYGPTDLVWGYHHPTNQRVYDSTQRLVWFLGGSPDQVPEAYRLASVTSQVTARAPRTLLIHGQRDQFVAPYHAEVLAARLAALGVPHDLLLIPYGQHGFDYVAGGLGDQITEAVILRFLAERP